MMLMLIFFIFSHFFIPFSFVRTVPRHNHALKMMLMTSLMMHLILANTSLNIIHDKLCLHILNFSGIQKHNHITTNDDSQCQRDVL